MMPRRLPLRALASSAATKSVLCASASFDQGSAESLPAMTFMSIARSCTVWVIGPAVSCVRLIGTMPRRETMAMEGFIPTKPVMDDGQTTEPDVSVPMAAAAKLTDPATPEPLLDPQADFERLYAFRGPPPTVEPLNARRVRKPANCEVLVFPRKTTPAARRRRATSESCAGLLSA